MPIYKMTQDSIEPVPPTRFSELKLTERGDLQRLLRDRIDIIARDTLVIAEEFGAWDDSRRRIDLLAIDKEGCIVVIELKRTEDGGHMELQAIRYAAMVSAMTFDQAIEAFAVYLKRREDDRDARTVILDFIEVEEESFGQDVRIVLASAEFSKELTTAALWLREQTVDIRCVRIQPYGTPENTLLDVQQVVPLPEAEDYQIRIERKSVKRREARESSRDFTRYDITIGTTVVENQPKRRAILQVIRGLVSHGTSPEVLEKAISWRDLFFKVDDQCDSDQMIQQIITLKSEGNVRRWFVDDDELIHYNGATYCLSNQWGTRTDEALSTCLAVSDSQEISVEPRR